MSVLASKQAVVQPKAGPLIPEKYLDVPSQRLYYLSLGALCQVLSCCPALPYIATNMNLKRGSKSLNSCGR